MNKKTILGVAAVALLGLSACNNSCDKSCDNSCGNTAKDGKDKEMLYSGILPAADAQGSAYTLKLEYDAEDNYNEGDYTLVENTLVADSIAASGLKVMTSSYSKGDFKKEVKQVNGNNVTYLQLIPDAKDALGTPSAASLYFIVNPDESLTMVSADLQTPENAELYTLTSK